MTEVDYEELQRCYGGQYIARRDGDVIARAATYDELIEQTEAMNVEWRSLVIEYVEPPTIVGVY